MSVVVLGAGVVGTATAYFLGQAKHQVIVLDRRNAPALETSFANGGQISASHASPWAGPSAPWQAFKWLWNKDAPLLFRPFRWDPNLWLWGLKFLANCTAEREQKNMERILRVALYSREILKSLQQLTKIQYHRQSGGILHIYRDKTAFLRGRETASQLAELGLRQEILDTDQCVNVEPALAHIASRDLLGGLLSPSDESGDANVFTSELAKLTQAHNTVFRFNTEIIRLETRHGKITRVITDSGDIKADAVVLCLGSNSPVLARTIGLKLPVYPAKGYSITVKLKDEDTSLAPHISITDETRFMVFSRLGNRLRAAGTAELVGWNNALNSMRLTPIIDNTRTLFPKAGNYEDLEPWCGLRPTTPDSVPLIGPTTIKNLYLNTGHGTLGWTMACGSGQIIADLLSGREPEIDMNGLGLERF